MFPWPWMTVGVFWTDTPREPVDVTVTVPETADIPLSQTRIAVEPLMPIVAGQLLTSTGNTADALIPRVAGQFWMTAPTLPDTAWMAGKLLTPTVPDTPSVPEL